MFLMLAQQELVGHSRDVIAHNKVPRFCERRFFISGRHRARRIEIVEKELFQAAHRAVAVFGNRGIVVDVFEEKAFQLGVALGESIAETGQKTDNPTPQQAWDVRAATVPLRVGWLQPDDISPAAVFLASDAANMVTGRNTK